MSIPLRTPRPPNANVRTFSPVRACPGLRYFFARSFLYPAAEYHVDSYVEGRRPEKVGEASPASYCACLFRDWRLHGGNPTAETILLTASNVAAQRILLELFAGLEIARSPLVKQEVEYSES